ncbi:MAG TPA: hypothetical protein VFQ85_05090 [Mycobacteriales bacterium]|jgi:glucosylceramidase|nr:hypothetical protein [Mycobacteriales bacterium]
MDGRHVPPARFLPLALLTSLLVAVPGPAHAGTGWTGWTTTASRATGLTAPLQPAEPAGSQSTNRTVVVYPTQPRQRWAGVGAALTDSSVENITRAKPGLLASLFGPAGAGLNLVRLPLSATDFSRTVDVREPDGDPRNDDWSWKPRRDAATAPPAQAEAQLAVLKQIQALRPDLRVAAVAWSAPPWLKTSRTMRGGALASDANVLDWRLDDGEVSLANLLLDEVRLLRARGVPLWAVSLGNEPFLSRDTYPTMTMSDQQMVRLAQRVQPTLRNAHVELWGLEHNWEHYGHAAKLIAAAPTAFDRVAFHCYGPAFSPATDGIGKDTIVSECGGHGEPDWDFSWQLNHLVLEPVRYRSTGLFMWNLALDQDHGHHLPGPVENGPCQTCNGVVTVDRDGTWHPGPEYYVLAHLAQAASPGSTVIGSTSDVGDVAAFLKDGTIGVVGQNASDQQQVISVRAWGGPEHRFVVPAHSMFTFRGPNDSDPVASPSWPGHIVRLPDGTAYYVDRTNYRHWIPDGGVFACLGGWANTLDGVSWEKVKAIPETEHAACFTASDGDIIRHPDGDSYVYQAGPPAVRRWIPSARSYVCARAEGRRVVPVTRYQVTEIAAAAPVPDASCIVRAPGGDAHFVNNEGRREWIPDSPTWDCERGRGVVVRDVPDGFVGTVDEVGWHYCLNKANLRGKVLRHADGDVHYIHPDDTRTWVPDSPTWQCRMRQGKQLVETRWREYVTAFPDTGWDWCFDPVVFRGHVLRHSDGDSYFVHPDDTKTWVPDGATYACRVRQGVGVLDTAWREYVNQFRGSEWDYCYDVETLKGRIISHPDGDSHYVDTDGRRHWIPSPGGYYCLKARGIPADTVRWRDYVNRTPEGEWAVCGDSLTTGQKLDRGQWLQSADGRYRLCMQGDGNLVIYNRWGTAVWATGRSGRFAIVQDDGNLVVYSATGAVWATNTVGSGANRLVMQSDGNLVLYSSSGRAVWASNTVGR